MTTLKVEEGYIAFPKRLSIGVLFLLGVQAGGVVWTASKLDSRIEALEREDSRMRDRSDERFGGVRARLEILERDRDRLTKVETTLTYVGDTVKRIEQKLDQTR